MRVAVTGADGFVGRHLCAHLAARGDEVLALPSGRRTRVRSITTWEGELASAHAPQSVVLTLEDEVDLSRGDMIAAVAAPPQRTTRFEATVVWMHAKPLRAGATYLLKHTTQTVRAQVVEIRHRIDVEHLEEQSADRLALNDIGAVVIEVSRPIIADLYRGNRTTGSFILIDPTENATSGAGMIRAFSAPDSNEKQIHTGVLTVGNRARLADALEQTLLALGALVLRTRVPLTPAILHFARLGAFVLIESTEAGPLTFNRADVMDANPIRLAPELELADPGHFLDGLQQLAAMSTGDDTHDFGHGI